MTWTRGDALRDLSDQQAEHADAMAAEAWDRNIWPDDERATAAELARDDVDDWRWWREHTADRPDPWGDGPVHHPTRFDLPVPAEPPF